MADKRQWEEFFDGHAPVYMQNVFVTNTLAEVDFIIEELALQPGAHILDVGCGTGRHSVELARRGFRMTGIDLSEGMLAEARKAAEAAAADPKGRPGVEIELIKADATAFSLPPVHDAAICVCEGAFGLLSVGEDPIDHDAAILRNIHAALKPGAPFLLTALNGMRHIRKASQADVEAGQFDPLSTTEVSEMEIDTPAGKVTVTLRERGWTPSEIALLGRFAGFAVEHVWGGTAGSWNKGQVDLDEFEVMVVARKA